MTDAAKLDVQNRRMAWLRDRLMNVSESISDELGLPSGWTDLEAAIDAAISKTEGRQ